MPLLCLCWIITLHVGPYFCAEGKPYNIFKCALSPRRLEVGVFVNEVYRAAQSGEIDDPSNLKNSKVFIFCGTLDIIVKPGKSNSDNQCPYEGHRLILVSLKMALLTCSKLTHGQ